jgi:hypothetical protein
MAVYTRYDPGTMVSTDLTAALLGAQSHIDIDESSIVLAGTDGGLNFYSAAQLMIGPGVLLTTGVTPNATNTKIDYGTDRHGGSDPALDAITFPGTPSAGGVSHDATSIGFNFTVDDPMATCVTFDIVFGSEDYSEYKDSPYTDLAAVFVNGEVIGNDSDVLGSVLSTVTADLPLFRNNSDGSIPIEYDGVTQRLTIVAPIIEGVNSIRFAIADRGDALYDSGLMVANLHAADLDPGGYLPMTTTNARDRLTGSELSDLALCRAGSDKVVGAGGDDQLRGEAGSDLLSGDAGADLLYGGDGADTLNGGSDRDILTGGAGADRLVGGAARDQFRFLSVDDSSASLPDTISNLQSIDRIDLSAIDADLSRDGDQRFTLVAEFTGHRHQAALIYDSQHDVTRLELDLDGDATADGVVVMLGDQIGVAHFIL